MNKAALIGFIPLLAALVVIFWLDPRTPHYRSSYDPQAGDASIARWFEHLNEWPRAPRYGFFEFDADTGRTRPVGKPEFAQKYAFGKYRYALVRGDSVLTVRCEGHTQSRVVLEPVRR